MCSASRPVILVYESPTFHRTLEISDGPSISYYVPYVGDPKLKGNLSRLCYLNAEKFSLKVQCLRVEDKIEIYPFGEIRSGQSLPKLPDVLVMIIYTFDKQRIGTVSSYISSPGRYKADLTTFSFPEIAYPLTLKCKVDSKKS